MRFESVTAYAFGPFHGKSLSFAPRMNIVFGPNEAGKSSWHAALYAGLCGVRRGRGRPRPEDSEFARRHRPWDLDRWEVGAVISLQNGRRIELRHDLDGRVDCSARDADIAGRDYSGEIISDGAPDGSLWLGLDRRSFLSTACVRQSDVLGLLDPERAPSLQEQLQAAVATAGTDETAAAALARLNDFHSAQVGLDRVNSSRPLRASRDRESRANEALRVARSKHDEYLARVATVEQLEAQHEQRNEGAAALEAAAAESAARRATERLARARVLAAAFPGDAPTAPQRDEMLAQRVTEALHDWETRQPIPDWSGPTIEELEQRATELRDDSTGVVPARPLPVPRRRGWIVAGAVVGLAGVLALALGALIPGLVALAVGAGLGLWALTRSGANDLAATSPPPSAVIDAQRAEAAARIETANMQDRHIREAREAGERALARLHDAAAAVGAVGDGPAQLLSALTAWQTVRGERLAEHDQTMRQWGELQSLLEGGSLESLEGDSQRLAVLAERLVAAVEPARLVAARPALPDDRAARDAATTSLRDWESARGELREFAATLPDVAAAEEELAAARGERGRVDALDATLATTIRFLKDAEERVHRDVAPLLRNAVLEWLPRITNGRYTDCRVDPETLTVEVSGNGGVWRRAALLSHGTAEQLYLLLRVAMTRHLTRAVEPCPLILDDVIAACDRDRRIAVLDALHELSATTQVILFSQEREVLDWAQQHLLHDESDRLIELDGTNVQA